MKLRIPLFAEFYDYTGIAQRLDTMAAKGWVLQDAGNWVWFFEKAERQTLHHSVVYFPDVSSLDPEPKGELLDYIAMCEAAGWQLAAQRDQMLIFRTPQSDPVPIDTDPVIHVDTVQKVMKKTHVRGMILVMLLALLQLWQYRTDYVRFPAYFLSDNFNLLHLLWMAALLLIACWELGAYWLWLYRAKRLAKQGVFVRSKRGSASKIVALTVVYFGVILLLFAAEDPMVALFVLGWLVLVNVVIAGMSGLGRLFKKRGYDTLSNQMMQMGVMTVLLFALMFGFAGFVSDWAKVHRKNPTEQTLFYPPDTTYYYYADTLPLSLEDLGVAGGNAVYDSRKSEQSSVLMEYVNGIERPVLYDRDQEAREMPAMSYTLYVAKWPALRDILIEDRVSYYTDFPGFAETDGELWQAECVLKHTSKEDYLVVWDDRVLEITFSWEPTAEQIASVTRIMKGGE